MLAARERKSAGAEDENGEQQITVGGTDSDVVDVDDDQLLRRRRRRPPSRDLPPVLTNRPLIGIISQPGDPATGHDSYIAASYVKFVEAAGARVVPFFHDAPAEETEARFAAVNGVLVPGGAARLAPGDTFFDVASRVIDLATEANLEKKEHFPILAICLGFEALGVHLSGNSSLFSSFDAEDTAAPLYFTEAAEKSRLFGSMPRRVRESLAAKPFARESHSWGISLTSFEAEEKLRESVEVLSLSSDPEGRVYVSSMEHKTLPFSATQWHPEKNAFEWGDKLHIPHSEGAVEVTHAVGKFFIDGARRNSHGLNGDVLAKDDLLIYNHPLTFTGRHEKREDRPWLDEAYIFPPWETWKRCLETRNESGKGRREDDEELCQRYRSPSADVQKKHKKKKGHGHKEGQKKRQHQHGSSKKVSLRLAGV